MKRRLTHVQVITLGYAVMVLVGALLLMLPIATAGRAPATFREAIFTSTSASCVTGLILQNTSAYWSPFGQAVILLLIQIGGLGFMTIATVFFLAVSKNMQLSQRETMVESVNLSKVNGIMQFAREIITGTLIVEGTGAVLLACRFIPLYGLGRGIWYSVFHSVSAFCNAGFDLIGAPGGPGSLVRFSGDIYVNLVVMALIIIGGLGYVVWFDLLRHGFRFRKYSLHTKLVLVTSAVLVLGGALLVFLFEGRYTGQGEPVGQRVVEALFASVTARTAGFNSVEVGDMSGASKLVTIFLMFVGGSPGSTAGGVKTTTLAVLFLAALSNTRGYKKPHAFERSIPAEAIRKSTQVFLLNLFCLSAAAVLLCAAQGFDPIDALFETCSAVSTVGMTTGITGSLNALTAYPVALLMFIGRVGSVSLSTALLEKHKKPPVTFPEAEVIVG